MRPPDNESRPHSVKAAIQSFGGDSPSLPNVSTQRRYWARMHIDADINAPEYGSFAWSALPDSHPGKLAAAIRAAECWASEGDDLEQNLRREIEAMRFAFKAEEDAEYRARASAHRQRVRATSFRPHPVNRGGGA